MLFYEPNAKIDTEHFRNHPKYKNRHVAPVAEPDRQRPISLVTRCMNRLRDLKITLPKNIEDNLDYGPLQHVIVDYNSEDGLCNWVKATMMRHIESGRLVFYRTNEPKFFQPNHAQNVTFRAAEGELVANVDSDNFTHKGYATRLNQCAAVADRRVLIVPDNFLLPDTKRLLLKGRFCLYREDIDYLAGFDEDLDEGFGNDDINFVLRAMLAGFRIVRYESWYADDRLPTTDKERTALVRNKDHRAIMERNGRITWAKLARGIVAVNKDKHWGKAVLTKNFREVIEV